MGYGDFCAGHEKLATYIGFPKPGSRLSNQPMNTEKVKDFIHLPTNWCIFVVLMKNTRRTYI